MMATLTRWEPFTEMTSLRDAMNQLLAESFVSPVRWGGSGQNWAAMDVAETEQEYTVKLAVPGLKADQFDISASENGLVIRGKTEQQQEQAGTTYHVREWRTGEFSRSVQFPTPVNTEQIQANLADGVLTLRVPKSERAMPKRITINTN
jgi:HSP20 family protein